MENDRAFESREGSEGRTDTTDAEVELNDATFEPEARVEEQQDFDQAEAVQSAFTEAVDAVAMEQPGQATMSSPQQMRDGALPEAQDLGPGEEVGGSILDGGTFGDDLPGRLGEDIPGMEGGGLPGDSEDGFDMPGLLGDDQPFGSPDGGSDHGFGEDEDLPPDWSGPSEMMATEGGGPTPIPYPTGKGQGGSGEGTSGGTKQSEGPSPLPYPGGSSQDRGSSSTSASGNATTATGKSSTPSSSGDEAGTAQKPKGGQNRSESEESGSGMVAPPTEAETERALEFLGHVSDPDIMQSEGDSGSLNLGKLPEHIRQNLEEMGRIRVEGEMRAGSEVVTDPDQEQKLDNAADSTM